MIPGQGVHCARRARRTGLGQKAWFLLLFGHPLRCGPDLCPGSLTPPTAAAAGVAHSRCFCYESFAAVHPAAGQPVGRGRTIEAQGSAAILGATGLRPRAGDRDALRQALLAAAPPVSSIQRRKTRQPAPPSRSRSTRRRHRHYRLKRAKEVRNGRMWPSPSWPTSRRDGRSVRPFSTPGFTLVRLRMRYPGPEHRCPGRHARRSLPPAV